MEDLQSIKIDQLQNDHNLADLRVAGLATSVAFCRVPGVFFSSLGSLFLKARDDGPNSCDWFSLFSTSGLRGDFVRLGALLVKGSVTAS